MSLVSLLDAHVILFFVRWCELKEKEKSHRLLQVVHVSKDTQKTSKKIG